LQNTTNAHEKTEKRKRVPMLSIMCLYWSALPAPNADYDGPAVRLAEEYTCCNSS